MDKNSRQIQNITLEKRALLEQHLLKKLRISRENGNSTAAEWQPGQDHPSQVSPIRPVAHDRPLPLSYSQERMWFIHHMQPDSPAYHVPAFLRLKGRVDIPLFKQSLLHIVRRHANLRTTFPLIDGQPRQVIAPEPDILFQVNDLADCPPAEREQRAYDLCRREVIRPFDLANGPLLRVFLYRIEPEDTLLFMVMHHIISDAWSMGVLSREVAEYYNAYQSGREPRLPELPIQYADFAVWQRECWDSHALDQQMAYWRRQLQGLDALDLPLDFPRPAVQTYHGATVTRVMPKDLLASLKKLSAKQNATLFMILLAAFKVLLFRYTNQEDIAVGVPIANRRWLDVEGLIGTFVNTLVLRTDLSANPPFSELLEREKKASIEAFSNQDISFAKIVAELLPDRDTSISPIFQAMFNVINVPMEMPRLSGLDISYPDLDTQGAQFDLTCTVIDLPGLETINIEYNTDLFLSDTIARMIDHYEVVLRSIAANLHQRIAEIPLISERERRLVLTAWNDTASDYPQEKCAYHLFEDQAARAPDAIAVEGVSLSGRASEQLTYGALNQRANQLARFLRDLGVGPQVPVAIAMERNVEMLVGLLGIMKAGGAYVPLDPAFPRDRLTYMISDVKAPVLVTQQNLVPQLPDTLVFSHVVCLDRDWSLVGQQSMENLDPTADPENTAYVLYTSGSTGIPKGVEVTHRNLNNILCSMQREPGIGQRDILLAVTTLSFDIAGLELFLPLIAGARVVVCPREIAIDGSRLRQMLDDCRATLMQATPATWRLLIEAGWQAAPSLRILCGGETLSQELAGELLARCQELWNVYGPTETTIWSTLARVTTASEPVSIGRPVANTQVYLLDALGQPVPIGVRGEMYIGGDGVARGYRNLPELTAQRFLPDPFRSAPGARMYRTGDLARFLPDGRIHYLGRMDNQVKLRGYRIELGEIESLLARHPAVSQAVVVVREDTPGDRRLAAYLTLHAALDAPPPSVGELRDYLRQSLPDYMIPSLFSFLDEFPLTPNRKIDRRALPAPQALPVNQRRNVIAPRTEIEQGLADIWKNLLKMDGIGVQDNFFDLGGHSMLAVQMLAQVQQAFDVNIPVTMLFQKANIQQLAEVIFQQQRPQKWPSLVEIRSSGDRKPLFCVHGLTGDVLWFFMLLPYLDPNQPVWGLESRGLDGMQPPFTTIEEMAAYYIQLMRNVQPEGPYHLCGYSFGGSVAFEIARQLKEAGDEIGLLAVLDHATPKSGYYQVKFGPEFLRGVAENLPHRIMDILRLRPDELLARVQRYLYVMGSALYRLVPFAQKTESRAQDLIDNAAKLPAATQEIIRLNNQALLKYDPGHYPGEVTLLRARGGRVLVSHEQDMGWSRFADRVNICIIPGSHLGLFKDPNIRYLANQIQGCLDAATNTSAFNPE